MLSRSVCLCVCVFFLSVDSIPCSFKSVLKVTQAKGGAWRLMFGRRNEQYGERHTHTSYRCGFKSENRDVQGTPCQVHHDVICTQSPPVDWSHSLLNFWKWKYCRNFIVLSQKQCEIYLTARVHYLYVTFTYIVHRPDVLVRPMIRGSRLRFGTICS